MAQTYQWRALSGAWNTPGNWIDTSTNPATNPSTTAPGAGDTATITGPAQAYDVLSGPGAAASFTIGNDVALAAGSFQFGALGTASGGNLAVTAGVAVTANSFTLLNGDLAVDGSGASLAVAGAITGGGYGGEISVGAGGRVTAGSVSGATSIVVDAAGTVEIGTAGNAATGALTIDSGAAFAVSGSGYVSGGVTGAIVDNGTIAAGAGSYVTLAGPISGTGVLTIAAGATVNLTGAAAKGIAIDFTAATGTLNFVSAPTAVINGFTFGDQLRTYTGVIGTATYAQTSAGMGTLTLTGTDGTADGTLTLAGNYAGDSFLPTLNGVEVASGTTGAGSAPPSAGTSGSNYQWAITTGGDWGTASNWGAAVAPGANDTVSIAGGSSPFVVRGQGQSASLTTGQVVGLGGVFSTGAFAIGQSGTLVLTPGTTLTATSGLLYSAAALIAEGAGTAFRDSGLMTLFANYGAGPSIAATGGATVQLGSILVSAQSNTEFYVDPDSVLEIGTAGGAQAGVVTVDAGPTVQFNGYIRTGLTLKGNLELSGSGAVAGAVTGAGSLILDAGSAYTMAAVGSAIQFNGSSTLYLTQAPTGTISGFGAGDAIDFEGLSFNQTQYSAASNTLTLQENGSTVATLQLSGNYSGDTFVAVPTPGYGLTEGGDIAPAATALSVAVGVTGAGSSPVSAGTAGESYVWTAVAGDYGVASNYTANGSAATVAPGVHDTVAITAPGNLASYGPGVDDGEVVRGQGASAALTLTGDVVLGGSFTTGVLTVQPAASYQGGVVLAAGTSLTAASAVLSGNLDVSGASLTVSGAVTGSANINASGGAHVQLDSAVGSGAVADLTISDTATIEFGGVGGATPGAVTIDAGQTVTASSIAAPLVLNGTLDSASYITLQGPVSGTGSINVAAGGSLQVEAALGAGISVNLGAGASVDLQPGNTTAASIAGTISGLAVGDSIYLASNIDAATYTATGPGQGTLALSSAGTVEGTLNLVGSFSPASFVVQAGQVLLAEPACYCAGTLILTDQGEVPVESLRIGDRVVTASGDLKPIRWIGRRSFAPPFVTGRSSLLPILFQAGALGGGLPRRDLRVSPCHAMAIDGVLIPARALVNGTTIVRDAAMTRIDYLHVELDAHDIILAEGAASETFLDDGSRGVFHNAADYRALYPDAPAPGGFCARRVESGAELDAIRRRLDASLVQDAWLAGEGTHSIPVGPGACAVRINTGAGFAPGDARRLGVAISRITLDGAAIGLDTDALVTGWHGCEAGWRWTDGAALVLVSGAARLVVEVASAPFATPAVLSA